MRSIDLSRRLSVLAEWVEPGARVIDVGTDHGYLPVFLALDGRCESITASDLRPAPLDHARESAALYGVGQQIEFVLTPGLEGIPAGSADTVVIAGMGGETIMGILEAAPWTRDMGVKLLLQPQSKLPELRRWLFENGYATHDERLILEAGKFYFCMLVTGGQGEAPDMAELYFGKALDNRDGALPDYMRELKDRTLRSLEGIGRADAPDEARMDELSRLIEFINDYLEVYDAEGL